ncbi:helix-turn-helix domain-containing protein [Altererythrobacter arenosus]|uniref:Helix-turn-helix domain-containing protein n=1 Tax=Altererythrobacter arenosus TaxID=3032592 RepID=A0ABY8FMR1_9SPHN|nr:helix-turn-helix domain-containing protein [Altererythrobacter sp. CAU 1644]WFL76317.1 helix-turn-helix domain-containing protein [Altererythrobacter sp. CAU 1644]
MKMESIRACSIWRALEVVGDVPVLLILEQALQGRHRFDEFVVGTGLSRSVLSNRLAKLVAAGVLVKAKERQKGYALTEMGRTLFPVALMILRWQSIWEPEGRSINVKLIHRACGKAMVAVPVCHECEFEIDPRDVDWEPGPGLTQVTPTYSRRRQQTAAASAKRGNVTMVDSVIELFGDRWATLVVRACFTGIHRFDEIQRDTLMATNILSGRIERLLAQDILKAVPYSTHQDRFEYRLTPKGRDLYPVLLALLQWGDAWFADAKGPPLLLTHRKCGHGLRLKVLCSECSGELDPRNTTFEV